jgi:hypothetical protein
MRADISVHWTWIPVRLKILKLLIRELSNIMEGEGNVNVGDGDGVDGNGDGWQSDEEDEEWEDVPEGSGDDREEEEVLEDLLKGTYTKVSYWSSALITGIYY